MFQSCLIISVFHQDKKVFVYLKILIHNWIETMVQHLILFSKLQFYLKIYGFHI